MFVSVLMFLRHRRSCSVYLFFFFSSRRRHTRFDCDWSSDVCSSDLVRLVGSRRVDRALLWYSAALRRRLVAHVELSVSEPFAPEATAAQPTGSLEIGRASCRGRG